MSIYSGGIFISVTSGGVQGVAPSVIADPYSVSKAYSKGDLVMNNGYLYSALEDMEAGEWDATKWLKTNVSTTIPTKVSELQNDAGFITSAAGTWENAKNFFITNTNVKCDQLRVLVNRTLMLLRIEGNTSYTNKISSGANVFLYSGL